MWPQVPIIHMYYRMTQLARAFALNAALSGPAYISTILVRSGTTLLSCQLVQMHKATPHGGSGAFEANRCKPNVLASSGSELYRS